MTVSDPLLSAFVEMKEKTAAMAAAVVGVEKSPVMKLSAKKVVRILAAAKRAAQLAAAVKTASKVYLAVKTAVYLADHGQQSLKMLLVVKTAA